MAGHIFVSYSRTDEAYVQRLVASMRQAGLDVWVDRELDHADRWLATIREKIDTCAALVLVMTPAAERSEMVEAEVLYARDTGKEVFALLLDGQPFWYLRNRQYESVAGGRLPGPDWMSRLTPARPAVAPAPATVAPRPTPTTGPNPRSDRRAALVVLVKAVMFGKPPIGKRGYSEAEVDDFLDRVVAAMESGRMSPDEVRNVVFHKQPFGTRGYDENEVDAFLDHIEAEVVAIIAEEEQAPAP